MQPTIEQLIAEEKLESVSIDSTVPQRELDVAFRHFDTARLVAGSDPEAAFQLLYDSARKALQAVLATKGLRVRKPPRGNHFTFVLVARTSLVDPEIWGPLNWMRELSNDTEYWEPGKQAAIFRRRSGAGARERNAQRCRKSPRSEIISQTVQAES